MKNCNSKGVSRRVASLAVASAWMAPPMSRAQTPGATAAPLEVGVLPNISPRVLVAQYQPVREYLSRELKRPVQVSTAPNWGSFHQRTLSLDYDLVVTGVHLARLAQLDKAYVPLLTYSPDIKSLLAFANHRPLKQVADLAGQTLVLSNPQSLVALRGLSWLAQQGLLEGRDFKIIRIPTDDSVGNVLARGDAQAALLSGGEFRAIPEAVRTQITVFTTYAEVPGFAVMANPRMPAAERAAVRSHWLALGAGTDDGKAFFTASGFSGFREMTPGLMESMDSYVEATRRALAAV